MVQSREDFSPLIELNPKKPNFFADRYPKPNIRSMKDLKEAYIEWARRSDVLDWVEGATMRIVARDLERLVEQSIPHGLFQGNPRFVSESLAKSLNVKAVRYPTTSFSWLNGTVRENQAVIAYHQGSSEFGSSQQQNELRKHGYMPPIFEKYVRYVICEEGEHGLQMGYWLLNEFGSDLGGLLVEDLLARIANSDDPTLQQPLIEFNPIVETLPEMGHYFDKQDRDGWSQLENSKHNANALYAGQMRYFLAQEGKHLGSGDQIIGAYLEAGRIPMDLHLKMEWEWSARSYRLHGNPYNSSGALTYYQIGSKNPIRPLPSTDKERIKTFSIPHPEGPNGCMTIEITDELDRRHLNGYALSVLQSILLKNNRRRSKLLSDKQRKEMRDFLEKITLYVPPPLRKRMLGQSKFREPLPEFPPIPEDGEIPTAALSWRPHHLAFKTQPWANDPWRHIDGYYTDVFGFPIPTAEEYREYRQLVDLTDEDRERIRHYTREPGWMTEIEPGSKLDVYHDGPVRPGDRDTVLFEFVVRGKTRRFSHILTMPTAMECFEAEEESTKALSPETGADGLDTLWDLHTDIVEPSKK